MRCREAKQNPTSDSSDKDLLVQGHSLFIGTFGILDVFEVGQSNCTKAKKQSTHTGGDISPAPDF